MKKFIAVLMTIAMIIGATSVIASAENEKTDDGPFFGLVDIPQIMKTAFPKAADVIEFFSPVLRIPMFVYALFAFLYSVIYDIVT